MMSSSKVWLLLGSVAMLAVLSVALTGCPPQEPTDQMEEPVAPPEPAEMDDTGDTADVGDTGEMDQAEAVEVTLTDYEIDMPEELPAGMTTFHVMNEGEAVHNIEIEGQGIERELEADLQPGESGTMEVDLQPGEYEVYCPVGEHADMGMRMTLTVEE